MAFDQYAYTKYNREVEKLPEAVKEKVVETQQEISEDPFKGKPLKGDLKGWRSYPFPHKRNSYRLAYKVDEEKGRVLFGSIGSRQGFYDDLKGT